MNTIVEIAIAPSKINDEAFIKQKALQKARLKNDDLVCTIIKRSIDARGKSPVYRLRVSLTAEALVRQAWIDRLTTVNGDKTVIIVGAGPAGYFAALECIKLGLCPIVLDRGKDVQTRRRDLRAIQQRGEVNPHSNYCFGEGGAGTYSDGKLYTRSHKRGNIQEILEILVDHGAKDDILIDAHPHIGSNKLPKIIANIRETIEQFGGRVVFDAFVTDLIIEGGKLAGVLCANGDTYKGQATILATGHSARDIFKLLDKHRVRLEPKPFAMGVRVEHPQPLIDEIQYNQRHREENLPASSYRVTCQVDNEGVFSFCMCPGGLIVPASTAPGELVVNGMSLSRRDSPFANSGFVTAISNEMVASMGFKGVFANMDFQASVEQAFFAQGNGDQAAPALRMTDFTNRKVSSSLLETSYIPGIYSAPVFDLFPKVIYHRLSQGMMAIGKKMRGFYSSEAQVIGIESRTSSPIRIPRDGKSLMNDDLTGLFPCGEGAGYAGGILSAAIDGRRVANAVGEFLNSSEFRK